MNKKKRLIWQIYPSYLLITLVSLLAASWYTSNSLRHFFLEQTTSDLLARGELVKKQIARHIFPPNPVLIDVICKEIGGSNSTRITVILPNGKVVGDSENNPLKMDNHSDRPEVISATSGQTGTSIRFSRTLQQSMLYAAAPLKINGKVKAVLRTSIPLTHIDNELKSIQIKIAFGGLFIAFLASGASLYISRRISRPIEKMKQGAEHFAKGDLRYKLLAPNTKEMASLAEAMNKMAGQLEKRLKTITSQRNEYEAVLSSMKEGVIAVDMEEHIISINQTASNMLKCNLIKLKGKSIQEVVRNRKLHRLIMETLSMGKTIESDIFLQQNGEKILNVHTTLLVDAAEKRIGTVVVLNDVTKLRHLENMRRDFVANVSHEIKTPLTAIKGFVETLVTAESYNSKETKHFLTIIEKHVNRLTAIIEDLLQLSKIEKEKDQIQLEEIPIKDIIESSMQLCRTKAKKKKLQIKLFCEDSLKVKIDPGLFEQAVVNLLDNAIKYSNDESKIHIDVIMTDSETIINFQDFGIGISKKHLPRLFERFYRADTARSRKFGGTGLGLAIVKHIVHAHQGYVTVDSFLGKGSTFSIHLPR